REWTSERVLRAPSYKGLRDDKSPREVVIEDGFGQAVDGEPPDDAVDPEFDPASPEALFDEVRPLPEGALEVLAEGRRLRLSNWDKVLFPATGFTKGDLIAYYARVAPVAVPHVHGRPLTLKRYPEGVDAQHL